MGSAGRRGAAQSLRGKISLLHEYMRSDTSLYSGPTFPHKLHVSPNRPAPPYLPSRRSALKLLHTNKFDPPHIARLNHYERRSFCVSEYLSLIKNATDSVLALCAEYEEEVPRKEKENSRKIG